VDYINGTDFSEFKGDPVVALESVQFDPQTLLTGTACHDHLVQFAESYSDGTQNWQEDVQAARRAFMAAELTDPRRRTHPHW
jgi:hypothetical protein